MKKLNYNCKQNDAVLKFIYDSDGISEMWVKIKGETVYTVIGFDDLVNGIKK